MDIVTMPFPSSGVLLLSRSFDRRPTGRIPKFSQQPSSKGEERSEGAFDYSTRAIPGPTFQEF
jgi:hypothetical protein